LQKAAEQEVAEQVRMDAAAKEVAAKQALERLRRTVARAKSKCEVPAPELSESDNLVYENAMGVPGASKQADGTIRLPEVTLADGTTALFAIDPDSCAHRIH
jgi:hypothetical protein